MEKIKNYKSATAVAIKIAKSKKELQLWDEPQSARIVKVEFQNGDVCSLKYEDSVTGEVWDGKTTIFGLSRAIWENRKFINHSGQLENL